VAGRSPVRLIDVTLRDAHQCLWATRMTTAMMRELAPRLDRAGFEAIDLVGGAVFDVCVRYLREDPWERMRTVASWVKETTSDHPHALQLRSRAVRCTPRHPSWPTGCPMH
jgi:oxaloacetate decarboxylase alpha subunit